jgi:hypothetical protein
VTIVGAFLRGSTKRIRGCFSTLDLSGGFVILRSVPAPMIRVEARHPTKEADAGMSAPSLCGVSAKHRQELEPVAVSSSYRPLSDGLN